VRYDRCCCYRCSSAATAAAAFSSSRRFLNKFNMMIPSIEQVLVVVLFFPFLLLDYYAKGGCRDAGLPVCNDGQVFKGFFSWSWHTQ